MRKIIAAILAALMLLAALPAAAAAEADYTLMIPGGRIDDAIAEIDGYRFLRTDVYLNGVTDDKLLTALVFDLTFDPTLIEYAMSSQDLGEYYLLATNAAGETVSQRSILINDRDAKQGALRFVFASDYGCRIEAEKPLISLYFFFVGNIAENTEIEFAIGDEIEAESVAMTEQNGNGRYRSRTVGVSTNVYTVTENIASIPVEPAVEIDPRDVEFKGATPYVVYDGAEKTPRVIVTDSETREPIDPKYYSVSYADNIAAGTASVEIRMRRGYTGSASTWFKIYLPPTTGTAVENIDEGILISWEPVEGATGYVIYRRAWNLISSGWTTFERWFNTTETSWVDGSDANHRVYAGTRYQYGVKAYPKDPMNNYDLGFVGPLKTTVRITTRTLESVTAGSRKLIVKWSASKVFTGYQLQYWRENYYDTTLKEVTIDDWQTNEWTIKSLNRGWTYCVRVRSYHEFEGMTYYGQWSETQSCKVK